MDEPRNSKSSYTTYRRIGRYMIEETIVKKIKVSEMRDDSVPHTMSHILQLQPAFVNNTPLPIPPQQSPLPFHSAFSTVVPQSNTVVPIAAPLPSIPPTLTSLLSSVAVQPSVIPDISRPHHPIPPLQSMRHLHTARRHTVDDMSLNRTKCTAIYCTRQSEYGVKCKATLCSEHVDHKNDRLIRLHCEVENCMEKPRYGYVRGTERYTKDIQRCYLHRERDDVVIIPSRACNYPNCKLESSYGEDYLNKYRRACFNHAPPRYIRFKLVKFLSDEERSKERG